MESPLAPVRRGLVSRQGILLAGKKGTVPGYGPEDGRQRLAGVSWGTQHSGSGKRASVWTCGGRTWMQSRMGKRV